MTNRVYPIWEYKFSASDAVLFDANVWLYIYGSNGDRSPRTRAAYVLALRRIRSVKGRIVLDGFVLSEFINAYARFSYNQLPARTKPPEFKIFRDSQEFKAVAEKIAVKARKILDKCQLTESGFETVNLDRILGEYAGGGTDFNDMMLASLCKNKNLKLVTHDADFKGDELTIITANPNLLS